MQQLENLIERPCGGGTRLVLCGAVRPGKYRLDQLEVPVAIDVPHKAVDRAGSIVEFVSLDRNRYFAHRACRLVRDPAVQDFFRLARIECRIANAGAYLCGTR